MTGLALAAALAWAFMLLFWGRFWQADQRLPAPPPDLESWPEVAAVIPARDEANTISDVVRSHVATDYPGAHRLILVDDGSADGTAALARAAGGEAVEIIEAPALEERWSGKLWALQAGIARAAELAPQARYLLLTDADIRHAPDTLRRLVAAAEQRDLALVSLMARLDARGFWGRLLIPAFVFFFQKLYPFPWANQPGHRVAAAAGGCVLVRREALEGIGGIAAIREALIDDCALAEAIKRGPPRRATWIGLADQEVVSLRDNRRLASVWTMVERTAFTQLKRSTALLVGAVLGMVFLYLIAPLAALFGLLSLDLTLLGLGALGVMLMAVAFAPTLRLYGQEEWRGLALPLAAALYTAMTVSSAIRHWRGEGGRWKGRTYG